MRAIHIASASHDDSIRKPSVLVDAPVVSANVTSKATFEKERKELQHEVAVVAHPVVLKNMCEHVTNKCLRLLLNVLRQSMKYGHRQKEDWYEVSPYRHPERVSTVIFHPVEQQFVCLSCTFFNIYGCPCPCIMAVYRGLSSPSESWR
eukprot:gb/GECG01015534.1/.p1 GENE.gb/GECG01015534.1/~~gb/GECG01015534.1/.p1  ORF type:complete len:148 (+),score=10.05 gb/GECG01015534.1/:1-444(+)